MLRLNLATDYALRTLLYLAARPGEQVTTREVCTFYGISADHVSKVVQHLVHGGYVRTGRGRTGGIRLGRPAAEISVGEVVEWFEGPVALLECVTAANVCVLQPGCRLQALLARAGERLIAELRSVSLAELVTAPAPALLQLAVQGKER